MRIETKWLSHEEACLAIPMLIKAMYSGVGLSNDLMDLCRIDNFKNGYEVMDFVNSIDDGYFPDEYSPYQEEVDKYVKEIEEILNNDYEYNYAFFIKNNFCGFICFNDK